MLKKRIFAILIVLLGCLAGYFVYESEPNVTLHSSEDRALVDEKPFVLGLDLAGGTQLIYRADVSQIDNESVKESMAALRDVIERRINLFGVAEPNVQVERGTFVNQGEERLIIDLPGVTDINEAVAMIGQTPLLEFKIENSDIDPETLQQEAVVDETGTMSLPVDVFSKLYTPTELTGRYLRRATLEFVGGTPGSNQGAFNRPVVVLHFDAEGGELFAQITREHVGEVLAIFLDGAPISTPVVQEEITGGEAVISGDFTAEEAKQLVGRLNSGALPVPIELISTQSIGPTLGARAVEQGIFAGSIGFLVVALFLIFLYRLPGLIAVVALGIYLTLMLTLFKLIPVTLTAAGIAGFIISLGIAVDANILIFERTREELARGRSIYESFKVGFSRAWTSIRDSNISSIISAIILFWFGTSLIKGFALTFGIGVLLSMLSAITITRVLLHAVTPASQNRIARFFFNSGVHK